jgi:hypothetical protein
MMVNDRALTANRQPALMTLVNDRKSGIRNEILASFRKVSGQARPAELLLLEMKGGAREEIFTM